MKDKWHIYTYDQESNTAQKRKASRSFKDAESLSISYLREDGVDGTLVYNAVKQQVMASFGYFPVELRPKCLEKGGQYHGQTDGMEC